MQFFIGHQRVMGDGRMPAMQIIPIFYSKIPTGVLVRIEGRTPASRRRFPNVRDIPIGSNDHDIFNVVFI